MPCRQWVLSLPRRVRFLLARDGDFDDLLVLSFDGKGIAMRHVDLREATRKAAEAEPKRLQTRLANGEKPNRKRDRGSSWSSDRNDFRRGAT